MCRYQQISDRVWARLEPHLPGREGTQGVTARDNRLFINAVFWILHTGSRWRELPSDYGDWKNTYRRFCRWRDKGCWEKLLEILVTEPDFEWLMLGSDSCHADLNHRKAALIERQSGKKKQKTTQKYLWPWMRMVCRSKCLSRQLPSQIAYRLTAF